MRYPNGRTNIFMVLLVLILYGCTIGRPKVSEELQGSFNKMIPISEMNTQLRVDVIPENKSRNRSEAHILVENISDNPIYLLSNPQTSFVKIFVAEEDKWVELEERGIDLTYNGGDGFILQPENRNNPNILTTWVQPIFKQNSENQSEQVLVRILIVGELMSDDNQRTEIPVGAYVDLYMEP